MTKDRFAARRYGSDGIGRTAGVVAPLGQPGLAGGDPGAPFGINPLVSSHFMVSMQATTCMRAPRSSPQRPLPAKAGAARTTEDRLIDAAGRIFARDGLEAATTRDIARDAGLNEVTLFRHFGTKEGVLAAVVRRTFGPGERAYRMPDTGDLREDLREFARQYEQALRKNLALVRTCVGEIHRHRDYAGRVLQAIFQPLRADLIARLEKARAQRKILLSTDAAITADLLSGMILSGVLRDTNKLKRRGYTAQRYRAACVDVLWSAVAGPGGRPA